MNKEDEYWFWVMKALTNSRKDQQFYYDVDVDCIFSVVHSEGNRLLWVQNKTVCIGTEKSNLFDQELIKLDTGKADIKLLPSLSSNDKRLFLTECVEGLNFGETKSILLRELNEFSEFEELVFRTDVKKIDPSTFIKLDMQRGMFLVGKVKELYEPLGMSQSTFVLW